MLGSFARFALWMVVLATGPFAMGCAPEPTQLLVVVRGDLAGRITRVVVRTEDDCAEPRCTHEFAQPLPFSFGMVPREGAPDLDVTLDVEGWAGNELLITQRTTTRFVPQQQRLLDVVLDASCLRSARICGGDKTCRDGDCVPTFRDPESLPEVTPGAELDGGIDGAIVPGELDAGPRIDAGRIDGATDAGVIDAGATDASAVDSGENNGRDDAQVPLPTSCIGLADGFHRIDVDRDGPSPPFEVWCDSEWIVLGAVNGEEGGLGYDAPEWTGDVSMARPASELSSGRSALFEGYWRVPVTELRIVMSRSGSSSPNGLVVPLSGAAGTLRAAMGGGRSVGGTGPEWARLVNEMVPNNHCVIPGIPGTDEVVRVRIGVLFSANRNRCDQVVGWVGLGAGPSTSSGCAAPTTTAGGERLCGTAFHAPAHAVVMGR